MLTIRPFTLADMDDYLDMWWEASKVGHPFIPEASRLRDHDKMRDVLLPVSETYLALDGDVLIGGVTLDGNTVAGLFVHPDFHGYGYGLALMRYAHYAHWTRRGAPLQVEVFEQNTRAVRFYTRFGFEQLQLGAAEPEDLPERGPTE